MGRLAHMQTLLPLLSCRLLLFQNKCLCKTFHMKMTWFSWEWTYSYGEFRTKTHFATEAKVNFGLAYSSMSWLREPLIKCCDMLRWNVAIVSWPWSGLYTINSYSIFQYNPGAVSLAQVTCKDCIWEMNDKWNPLMEEQTLSSYDQASCEGQSCRDVAHSRRVKIDTKT